MPCLAVSPARIQWLDAIRKKYQVYLFSNTNKIHHAVFSETFRRSNNGTEFDSYFIKSYYSHEMGMRKPDPGSFCISLTNWASTRRRLFYRRHFQKHRRRTGSRTTDHFLPPPKRCLTLTFNFSFGPGNSACGDCSCVALLYSRTCRGRK